MEIYYLDTKIQFIETQSNGLIHPPKVVLEAEKLADIPETIFEQLSEEDIDQIYYFFFDLVAGE